MDMDPDSIKTATDVAQNIGEIASSGSKAFDAMGQAVSLIKSLKGGSHKEACPAIDEALVDLREQLSVARDANSRLREIAADLRDENTDLKRRFSSLEGYELFETKRGSVVYRNVSKEEPVHYLCPVCKENGFKSILQGDDKSKRCASNEAHGIFDFDKIQVPRHTPRKLF